MFLCALTFVAEQLIMKERSPMVFIVDDDDAVRASLGFLLKSVGIAATSLDSAQAFLAAHDFLQPGCLLLDIRMPGMSGLELQQQLNLRGAIIPVIFITGHGDVPMAVAAMKDGAFDFVQKPFRDQDLIDRVQRALAKDQEHRVALSQYTKIRARLESLTPREREVLDLIAGGSTNREIAAALHLSPHTIHEHTSSLYRKLGARNRADAVQRAHRLGLAG